MYGIFIFVFSFNLSTVGRDKNGANLITAPSTLSKKCLQLLLNTSCGLITGKY